MRLLLAAAAVVLASRFAAPYWTIARSETWAGTPHPGARYMATTGLSEWSTGLQLSGFRGSADLEFTPDLAPAGVTRTLRVTALRARVTAVTQVDRSLVVRVQPEPAGYEVVGVDISKFAPGARLTVVFQDPAGAVVAQESVLVE